MFDSKKCYYCNSELTEQEFEEWANSEICCSGSDCGCMGMPINPPICDKCVALDDKKAYEGADSLAEDFCSQFDDSFY